MPSYLPRGISQICVDSIQGLSSDLHRNLYMFPTRCNKCQLYKDLRNKSKVYQISSNSVKDMLILMGKQ